MIQSINPSMNVLGKEAPSERFLEGATSGQVLGLEGPSELAEPALQEGRLDAEPKNASEPFAEELLKTIASALQAEDAKAKGQVGVKEAEAEVAQAMEARNAKSLAVPTSLHKSKEHDSTKEAELGALTLPQALLIASAERGDAPSTVDMNARVAGKKTATPGGNEKANLLSKTLNEAVLKDAGPSPMKEVSQAVQQQLSLQREMQPFQDGITELQVPVGADVEWLHVSNSEGGARRLDANEADSTEIAAPFAQAKRELSGAEFLDARTAVQAKNNASALEGLDSRISKGDVRIGTSARLPSQDNGALTFADASMFRSAATQAPMAIAARVTQGAMAQNRLSSESLMSLSSGIANLQNAGGGEIRLRLNPEHLGEIRLQVKTQGNEVGIRIEAAKPEAQRILEESLSSLKDSLSQHRLTLAHVDVSTSSSTQLGNSSGASAGSQDGSGDRGMPWFSGNSSGQSGHSSDRQDRWSNDRSDLRAGTTREMNSAAPWMPRATQNIAGRLNVMA